MRSSRLRGSATHEVHKTAEKARLKREKETRRKKRDNWKVLFLTTKNNTRFACPCRHGSLRRAAAGRDSKGAGVKSVALESSGSLHTSSCFSLALSTRGVRRERERQANRAVSAPDKQPKLILLCLPSEKVHHRGFGYATMPKWQKPTDFTHQYLGTCPLPRIALASLLYPRRAPCP